MKYIKNTLDFQLKEQTAVTLGKFDGLHRGHELLIQTVLEYSKRYGLRSVAFTFDIPPKNKVERSVGKVLTTNEEKEYIFEQQGIDYLIECPFTTEVMSMEAEHFIAWISQSLQMKYIVVGDDFRFGHNRTGDYHLLLQYEKKYGYQTIVIEKLKDSNRDISSTYIREKVAEGDIKKANALLGYPYFMKSKVVHGQKLGHKLGIPTMNMLPVEEKLLPPNGVYVTEVSLDGKKYLGVTNIGCKPTVSNKKIIGVETYIDGFEKNIYGETPIVSFLGFLRPEQKFHSIEELKEQMEEDITKARSL